MWRYINWRKSLLGYDFTFTLACTMPELVEGEDYYWSPEGYVVLTEKHHLNRGYCCGMGCKHCPYDYDAVPEPQQSQLVAQRQHETKKP